MLAALWCLTWPWLGHASGQSFSAQRVFGRYQQEVWRDQNGLPQSTVLSIAQTPDGYMWFGTLGGGIARFDGVRFTVFDTNNTAEITSDVVTDLVADPAGDLWAATEGGLLRRAVDGRFTRFTAKDGISEKTTRLLRDNSGDLWIGSSDAGLFRYHGGRFTALTVKDGLTSNNISALADDREGGIWIGTDRGLSHFKAAHLETFTIQDGLPGGFIRSLCRDRAGDLWIGFEGGGLSRLRDGRFTSIGSREGLLQPRIPALFEDKAGTLWVGTIDGGVYQRKGDRFVAYTMADGLPGNRVVVLFQSAGGDIWIGTDGGLSRLRESRFLVYTTQEGLADDFVLAVYEDKAGNLWAGSGFGVTRFKDGAATVFTMADGLSSNEITAIGEDKAGDVWIGTSHGVNRFHEGRFTSYFTTPGAPENYTDSIYCDRAGNLLAGTRGAGASIFRGDHFEPLALPNELRRADILAFFEDNAGSLWIGTRSNGVSRLKDGKWRTWTTKDGLANDQARCFFEEKDGTLWIGTHGGGLSRWKDGKFVNVGARDGLFDNIVFQILADDSGNFWMDSNRGIFRVPLQELNDFADGKIPAISSYAYGLADGMPSRECNGNRPAGWKTRDGRLFFPTTKGLVAIDPGTRATQAPRVVIEQVRMDQTAIRFAKTVRMKPEQTELEIQYTGLSWNRPQQIKFKYQLAGLDHGWTDAGTRRTVNYSHLPPGDYTFRVQADNGEGVWSVNAAEAAVTVSPPFWRTWWFYSLGTASIIALVLCGFGFRARQLQRQQAAQENFSRRLLAAHETERLRIAAELHDSLGQSLAMIKNSAVFGAQSANDSGATQAQFECITEQSSHAIGEVREISYDLRPYMLDQFGLAKAIKSLLDKIADASSLQVKTEIDDVSGLFPADVEMSIYRIVQESLNNILKHAAATEVMVVMRKSRSSVQLEIRDNGKGFEVSSAGSEGRGGFGLIGISERVRLLGGTHAIRSAPGEGTAVSVTLECGGKR